MTKDEGGEIDAKTPDDGPHQGLTRQDKTCLPQEVAESKERNGHF